MHIKRIFLSQNNNKKSTEIKTEILEQIVTNAEWDENEVKVIADFTKANQQRMGEIISLYFLLYVNASTGRH